MHDLLHMTYKEKFLRSIKTYSFNLYRFADEDKNPSITAKLISSNANSTIGQSPSSESDMTGTTHIPLQRGIDDCITEHGGQRHSQASFSSVLDRNPDLIPTSSSSSKGKLIRILYFYPNCKYIEIHMNTSKNAI